MSVVTRRPTKGPARIAGYALRDHDWCVLKGHVRSRSSWRLERLADELRDVTGGTLTVGEPNRPVCQARMIADPHRDLRVEPYVERDWEELSEHL